MDKIDIEYLKACEMSHIQTCEHCKAQNLTCYSGIVCNNGGNLLKLEGKKLEANIKKEFRNLTLDKLINETLAYPLNIANEYVRNYKENLDNGIGLFLCGEETGTGKSAIAHGIAIEFLKRDKTAYCIGFDHCIDLLSSRLNTDEYKSFRNKILTVDLLVLDDLGLRESLSEKQTEFVRNNFTLMFKERSNNLKPILITSNKVVGQLERLYGKQFMSVFMSRIKTIEFKNDDYRTTKLNVGGYQT